MVESVGEVDDVIRNPLMLSCVGEFGRSECVSGDHAIVRSFLGCEFWWGLMIWSCPADHLVGKFSGRFHLFNRKLIGVTGGDGYEHTLDCV